MYLSVSHDGKPLRTEMFNFGNSHQPSLVNTEMGLIQHLPTQSEDGKGKLRMDMTVSEDGDESLVSTDMVNSSSTQAGFDSIKYTIFFNYTDPKKSEIRHQLQTEIEVHNHTD